MREIAGLLSVWKVGRAVLEILFLFFTFSQNLSRRNLTFLQKSVKILKRFVLAF